LSGERKRKECEEAEAAQAARKKRLLGDAKKTRDEEDVAERLKFAKKLIDLDETGVAELRLQKLVETWPCTKAAADARELLKKRRKKDMPQP